VGTDLLAVPACLTRAPRPPNPSGQPIYNDFYMTMFNVVFTAAAPLVVGWFDRDLDKGYGIRFPMLYTEGEGAGAAEHVGSSRWSSYLGRGFAGVLEAA
jgi:hypothetical protein